MLSSLPHDFVSQLSPKHVQIKYFHVWHHLGHAIVINCLFLTLIILNTDTDIGTGKQHLVFVIYICYL